MTNRELELVETMRDGSRREVRFGKLITRRADVIHDVTSAPSARFAVLSGAKVGVILTINGDKDPRYITGGPFIFGDREAAEARAREIASVRLVDAVRGDAPYGYPFNGSDYYHIGRYWFEGVGEPRPEFYSSAIIAEVNPSWVRESNFTLPMREGLTYDSLRAIGALADIEIGLAMTRNKGVNNVGGIESGYRGLPH